jgi:type IV pilus assembly protein PilC
MMPEEENLATTGTESFSLQPETKAVAPQVILNIEEDDGAAPVHLDKSGSARFELTGNPLIDTYRRVNRYFIEKSGVKTKDKAAFFHLLSVMINAGIPVGKSLTSLSSQLAKSPRLQMVAEHLASAIESGSALSEALLYYPDVFGDAEVGMIKSGEATGQLAGVLGSLAKDTEKSNAIKSKVKSAMMYPAVIFCLLIVVIVAMMVFVIPKLTSLFESAQGELPLVTRIVVGTSDFFIERGLLVLIGVIALWVFLTIYKKTESGRFQIDRFKLKIPVFGGLLQKTHLSRFARSLSNLLDSNVTIVETLKISANSVGNEVYRRRLLLAVEDIKQGIPLAENLSSSDLFPPMMVNMIEVGEQTAQVPEITAKIASFYEDEIDTAVAGISKIIEPIILVIIGLTVGTVVAAIMLPIMQLSDLTGSV